MNYDIVNKEMERLRKENEALLKREPPPDQNRFSLYSLPEKRVCRYDGLMSVSSLPGPAAPGTGNRRPPREIPRRGLRWCSSKACSTRCRCF